LILTILGFTIGFIAPDYRFVAWGISFLVLAILGALLIFRDYIKRIDDNEIQIKELRKDLNISDRLSKLEGKK